MFLERVEAGTTTRGRFELFCLLYFDEKIFHFSMAAFQIKLRLWFLVHLTNLTNFYNRFMCIF